MREIQQMGHSVAHKIQIGARYSDSMLDIRLARMVDAVFTHRLSGDSFENL
ncbi:hypothetical protein SDC9_178991 [bioreactor metagenome]|uniref:Uncharacterized protein n=1 Tax=bioreactor metagenome TaxID=1076179 RepID=A0A645GXQ6_9ZZZZ